MASTQLGLPTTDFYSPLKSGLALLPESVVMFAFSSRFGRSPTASAPTCSWAAARRSLARRPAGGDKRTTACGRQRPAFVAREHVPARGRPSMNGRIRHARAQELWSRKLRALLHAHA